MIMDWIVDEIRSGNCGWWKRGKRQRYTRIGKEIRENQNTSGY